MPRLVDLRPATARAEVLRTVRDAGGALVEYDGRGGGDQRFAVRLARSLEPFGVQWTIDRWGTDEVVLKLSDGQLPGWVGSPVIRMVDSPGVGPPVSYTN